LELAVKRQQDQIQDLKEPVTVNMVKYDDEERFDQRLRGSEQHGT